MQPAGELQPYTPYMAPSAQVVVLRGPQANAQPQQLVTIDGQDAVLQVRRMRGRAPRVCWGGCPAVLAVRYRCRVCMSCRAALRRHASGWC